MHFIYLLLPLLFKCWHRFQDIGTYLFYIKELVGILGALPLQCDLGRAETIGREMRVDNTSAFCIHARTSRNALKPKTKHFAQMSFVVVIFGICWHSASHIAHGNFCRLYLFLGILLAIWRLFMPRVSHFGHTQKYRVLMKHEGRHRLINLII